jgi:hypothetical protein
VTNLNVISQFCCDSVCEACGASFSCGVASEHCWCAEVKVSEAALAKLRARYRGCICNVCLKGYAEVEEADGKKEEQVSAGAAH